jgi:hypothetical protein
MLEPHAVATGRRNLLLFLQPVIWKQKDNVPGLVISLKALQVAAVLGSCSSDVYYQKRWMGNGASVGCYEEYSLVSIYILMFFPTGTDSRDQSRRDTILPSDRY